MTQRKRIGTCLLILCLMVGILGLLPVQATTDISQPAKTSNVGNHEYAYDRWASPINSYLVNNQDGTLSRIEFTGSVVTVEMYDCQLNFLSGMQVNAELPLFGGFYSGQTYNFLVFGQVNPTEQADCEVIRVVRYTKDWQRIDSGSLFGANTTVPFDAGSLRFVEYGGYLYIRTAHEMYTGSDGKNHQANLMLNIRISDMTITDSLYDVKNSKWGYISHSFNQFIAVDGSTLVAVDHGDARPRSVVMSRYYAPAGQDKFLEPIWVDLGNGYYTRYYVQSLDVFPIGGSIGDNDTGVALGGFEISDTHYLVAGNSVSMDEEFDADGQRNIFIAAVDASDFTSNGVTIHYLTEHESDVYVSNPHFIQLDQDNYCIMWQETGSETEGLRFGFVNGKGQLQGQIYTVQGVLSDCKPIVWNNKLVWYVTNASTPAFFTIDLSNPYEVSHDHIYAYEIALYPGYSMAGRLTSTCAVCGKIGPNVEIPAIKNYQYYTLYQYIVAPTCTENGVGYYTWNEADIYGVTDYAYLAPAPALGHDYEDGVCTNCGEADPNASAPVEWVGTQLQATSNLDMQFALRASDLGGTTGNYIVLTRTYADGREHEEIVIDQSNWTLSGNFYIVAYSGLAAKEMGDAINAVAYDADGNVISETRDESIVTYAQSMLGKITNDEQKTMFVDLLNYGAEAQKFFRYNEEHLANANLTAEQKAWGTQETIEVADHRVKGKNFYGSNLSLENVILLQMAFKVTPAEGMYAMVTYTNHNGKEVEEKLEVTDNNGYSMVSINSLAIADYRTLVTCTLYDADGNVVGFAADSMESYVARSQTDLGKAIMRFGASAYAYFH